ncbi:MAG: metal-dependent hydrolase, partial [Nevskiales bacterium]
TALAEAGYPAQELEAKAVALLNFGRKILPQADQLANTIALEHFTAIMAETLLTHAYTLDGAPPRMAALWRWHAIEETEHKAVAFDVYQAVTGGGLRAYLRRCLIMISVSVLFLTQTFYTHYRLIKHDGLQRDWRGWRGFLRFLFINPGALSKIALPWLRYFKPGFHPWQHNNRAHVERWKAAYAAAGVPPP